MNKEELIKYIQLNIECIDLENENELIKKLNEFFSQNVVIPKGKNRHPYADVLHQKLEDMSIELEIKQDRAKCAGFVKYTSLDYNDEFRIKPSEPVYEWQWYKIVNGIVQVKNELGKDGRDQFFTEEETNGFGWIRFEQTKRERKQ